MADAKLTELTELTAVDPSDLLAIVDDPAGTPITKKTTVNSVADAIAADSTTSVMNSSMSRQAIINGNFDVWQRGTSVANTTANSYTADRWYVDTATAGDDKTVSQQTADVNGSRYSCRVQRVNGETGHTVLRLSQALESQDSIKLRGNKLTLSFYLKVGANFSATSNILTAKILTGKGTDEKATAFTTSADAISSNITATTTSVKYTCTTTAAIASDITQIGISFSYDPTGTAGANDWFEVQQVQLCAGNVALPFMPKSFEEELRACQRYCFRIGSGDTSYAYLGYGNAINTTTARFVIHTPVTMRINPTLSANSTLTVQDGIGGSVSITSLGISSAVSTRESPIIEVGVASGLTAFRNYALAPSNDLNGYLILSADL